MKCLSLSYAALFASDLRVHAASVHLGNSNDGNIAIDMDMKPGSASGPERGHSSQPVHSSKKTIHFLEDYQVRLDYEIHAGKLSVSQALAYR